MIPLNTTFFWVFLGFYLLHESVHLGLEIINYKHVKKQQDCPDFFKTKITGEVFQKSKFYTLEKIKFSITAHCAVIPFFWILVFRNGFNTFDYYAAMHGGFGTLTHSVVFCIYLAVYFGIIHLPFKLYSIFVIEEKYGFNKMTPRLFIIDLVKSIAIGSAITIPLLYLVFWFMQASGPYWWLFVWFAVTAFQLTMTIVYPALLAPLFNKFTPLQNAELKNRITKTANDIKFGLAGIFVMDGSRRSSHSNAYFAGVGKFKRIVLFDTLITRLTTDELVAVLAHEMGHYIKKHIRDFMIIASLLSLAGFYTLALLIDWPDFYKAFNVSLPSPHTALVIFAVVSEVFTFALTPILNMLSRKNEFAADRFSVEATGHKDAMKSALLKLTSDNLSNLTPHPLYSFYHYSHPTPVERALALDQVIINKSDEQREGPQT
ncbi:MAG: M48 family metallopeptidase [Deltaproteobacteria bacterium]|nr:M48 family metallopeptidase [Deltaproteobacteria bacterium]